MERNPRKRSSNISIGGVQAEKSFFYNSNLNSSLEREAGSNSYSKINLQYVSRFGLEARGTFSSPNLMPQVI